MGVELMVTKDDDGRQDRKGVLQLNKIWLNIHFTTTNQRMNKVILREG